MTIPTSLAAHLLEMGLADAPAPLFDLAASRYSAETGVVTAWMPENDTDQPPF